MAATQTTTDAILDGALREFSRHGLAKTSMSDIAQSAGVSRTSLYSAFPTKADVFRALSGRINERVLAAVVAAISTAGTWDERLQAIISARVGWVYDLLRASEHGRELISEKNKICGGSVLAANDRFEALVAGMLAEARLESQDEARLARLLIQSVNGVLEQASTREEAEQGVETLVAIFCAGLTAAR